MSKTTQSRSVESPHYHVWTDALRGRDLAQTARDEWDRGTFVRWSISSAWTAFEHAVNDALDLPPTGTKFWPNFDDGCRKLGIVPPRRDCGLWQQVAQIQKRRNAYTHLNVVDQSTLLLKDATQAEETIKRLREAVQDLHVRLKDQPPEWIEDNVLPKYPTGGGGALTVGHGGFDKDDPDVIQVRYQYKDRERTSHILPPGTDPTRYMEQTIKQIAVPISAVRAYRGSTLVKEIRVRMRGSS